MKILPIYLVCFSVLYFGFVVITLLFSKSIRKNLELHKYLFFHSNQSSNFNWRSSAVEFFGESANKYCQGTLCTRS